MKRISSVVVAAVLAGAFAAACAQSSSADVTQKHLSLVGEDGKAKTFELVDLGKKGFGPADELIEQNPLSDSAGKAVGTAYTVLTITSGTSPTDAFGVINCSINLSGGRIFFAGSVDMSKLPKGGDTIPVVGGTGAYDGAGGTVTMKAPDDKHTDMSFDLLIPKTSS